MKSAGHPSIKAINRRVALARLVMGWEKLWRAGFAALTGFGFYLALSLFDIWRWLPDWLHLLAWLGVLGFAVWSLATTGNKLAYPSRRTALARIERDNQLAHQPLQAHEDRLPLNATAEAQALWRAHLARIARPLARLVWRAAQPNLVSLDPYGTRMMAAIAVVAGLIASGEQAPQLLAGAVWPFGPSHGMSGSAAGKTRIEAWITPPAYTGLAPILLPPDRPENPPIIAPHNSALSLLLSGPGGVGQLRLTPDSGPASQLPLNKIDASNQMAQLTLGASGRIAVHHDGRRLRDWRVNIVPDQPPSIRLAGPPAASQQGSLRLQFEFADDYGIDSATAEIVLRDRKTASATMRLALPLPSRNPKQGRQAAQFDLTAHQWAGQKVRLMLTTTDAAGQQGNTQPVELTLPAREFRQPLARALIEQRAGLAAPQTNLATVRQALDALSQYPEKFIDDLALYTGIRVAYYRLGIMRDKTAARSQTAELLWQLALRLEDGMIPLAADELRAVQNKLAEALQNGAGESEIADLTQQLRQALDRYLQAMLDQAIAGLDDDMLQSPGQRAQRQIDRAGLDRMLDQIEQLGKTGASEAAQKLLSELRDILENLQLGETQAGQSPQAQAYGRALDGLAQTMRQQQQLRDETYRQSQSGNANSGLPGAQGSLRDALGELMRRLGEGQGKVPDALGQAGQAMGDAAQALGKSEMAQALDDQAQALQQLRSGAQALTKTLREQRQSNGENGEASETYTDPLGRPLSGNAQPTGNSPAVPDRFDIQRALEIRRELERRASQRNRPPTELDYFERLLKAF